MRARSTHRPQDWTVKGTLLVAFGALTTLMLVMALLSIDALGQSFDQYEAFVRQDNARATLANDLLDATNARAVGARNLVIATDRADQDVQRALIVAAHEKVQASLASLRRAVDGTPDVDTREKDLLAAIEAVEARYGPVALAIVAAAIEGRQDEAIRRMNAECRPLLASLLGAGDRYLAHLRAESAEHVHAAEANHARNRALMIGGVLLSLAVSVALALGITRRILRSLGAEPAALGAVAQQVAGGDLRRLPEAEHAPAGSVMASLGRMQQALSALVGQVRTASDCISTGSSQIAEGNSDLSQRTEEQAANLQQTAASMEELHVTVSHNAETAQEAARLAASASEVAQRGGSVVGQVVTTMQAISASSHRIGDITGVIDGIAFQTNILALNAAVEAARAGEHGRGFAVVAGEVRALAQRAAEAAREIKSLIGASVEKVEEGESLVGGAGATMDEIVRQVRRVAELLGEISNATSGQTAGIGQVNHAVTQLDQVTQQNAALVEESAAAAESLRQQAGRLVELVSVFRV